MQEQEEEEETISFESPSLQMYHRIKHFKYMPVHILYVSVVHPILDQDKWYKLLYPIPMMVLILVLVYVHLHVLVVVGKSK